MSESPDTHEKEGFYVVIDGRGTIYAVPPEDLFISPESELFVEVGRGFVQVHMLSDQDEDTEN